VGCAYSLCVTYLRELEEAGWLKRVRHKHGDTEYILTRPTQAISTPEVATSQHAHQQPSSQYMGDSSQPNIEAQQQTEQVNASESGAPADAQTGAPAPHPQAELPQSSSGEMVAPASGPQGGSPLSGDSQSGTSSSGDSSAPPTLCQNLNFEPPQSSDFVISPQSSEFKVQSSANAYVPPVRTVLIKQQHAAAKMNFEEMNFELRNGEGGAAPTAPAGDLTLAQKAELKIIAAQFHKRLLQLLSEYNITGKKRADLAAQICKLVADNLHPERYEHVLADVKAGLEQAKKRKDAGLVQNAEAVGVRILMDYVATGQLTLFDVPAPETKTTSRGRAQGRHQGRTFRREQTPRHQGLPTEIAAMRRNAEQARLRGEYDKAAKWLESAAKAEARLAAQHANP
jgi:hypothetical protein